MNFDVLVIEHVNEVCQATFFVHWHCFTRWYFSDVPSRIAGRKFEVVSGIAPGSADLVEGYPDAAVGQMGWADAVIADFNPCFCRGDRNCPGDQVQRALGEALRVVGRAADKTIVLLMVELEDLEAMTNYLNDRFDQVVKGIVVEQIFRLIVGGCHLLDLVLLAELDQLSHQHGIARFSAVEFVEDEYLDAG